MVFGLLGIPPIGMMDDDGWDGDVTELQYSPQRWYDRYDDSSPSRLRPPYLWHKSQFYVAFNQILMVWSPFLTLKS
jgi:hypothetical protein